ncbi:uncharacterized protein LOC123560247 [Mercenaria mercenaria]|uniref:uncharacterized protein LOC123560247 n=1 Tax=Mercenaria mercenaria TaxID=6596 RepID=UPI00234F6470|nr:uncharacterized protein LOC123560247 [Mercenaria mercenaria]
MVKLCRNRLAKLYTAFVAITTFLIATDLIQFSASPFVFKIGKQDQFLGQLQINLKHLKQDEESESVPIFVKMQDARVYIFSAIITYNEITEKEIRGRKNTGITYVGPTAILSGWELNKYSSSNFTCCFELKDGTIVSELSWSKTDWLYLGKSKLQAKQFKCPINVEVSDIKTISIAIKNSTCPNQDKYFLPPTIVKRQTKSQTKNSTKIAVCVKLAYGSLDARRLIEWFEVHRLFGVEKVIAYTYHLNSKASKVLDFYENSGLAEIYDYDIPEKGSIARDVGVKNMQSWNDEQIALFDCQERLRNYDYVAVVDTDEFIIPVTKRFTNAWKIFMDKKFSKSNIAGLLFSVRVHADTWGPTNVNHPLHIGRYNNCTLPMYDRVKGVYMPSRVQQGSVSTHLFRPLSGYRRTSARAQEVTMHHFRSCRKEWLRPSTSDTYKKHTYLYSKKNTTKCFDLIRTPSKIMEQLADTVKDRVIMRAEEIGV